MRSICKTLALTALTIFVVAGTVQALPPGGGGNQGKVEICHVPPGNPDNAHTISVNANAVDAHLDHGDSLGECVDACADALCVPDHTAACIPDADSPFGYICECLPGFTGGFCEIDPCGFPHCQNGGICIRGDDGTTFSCECQPGYSGDLCENEDP